MQELTGAEKQIQARMSGLLDSLYQDLPDMPYDLYKTLDEACKEDIRQGMHETYRQTGSLLVRLKRINKVANPRRGDPFDLGLWP